MGVGGWACCRVWYRWEGREGNEWPGADRVNVVLTVPVAGIDSHAPHSVSIRGQGCSGVRGDGSGVGNSNIPRASRVQDA